MIARRQFLAFGALAAMAPRLRAQAQRVRIGILGPSPFETSIYAGGVVRGFSELGYAEGARATFDYRYADGNFDTYRKQAQELTVRRCDLLVALRSEPVVRALQFSGHGEPIVFLAVDYDPLERGVVSNLRRPDRNTTGVYVPQNVLVAKRIEILRELLPKAQRLMVFADSHSAGQVEAARKAAAVASFQLVLVQFMAQPYDYASYLQSVRSVEADAFMNLASPIFARDAQQIQQALSRLALPSIGTSPQQAEAGYLVSVGSNVRKVTRRVAEVGARLLGGTKASEIPVERVDDVEIVVNLATARALGLKVPDALLAKAARTIQ